MTYKYYFKYRLENGEKGTGSVCASDIKNARETAKNRFGAKIEFYDFTTNNEPCFTGLVTLIPNETETNEQEETKMKYDYVESMKRDILDYIADEIDRADYDSRDELETALNDDLWPEDAITGNGCWGYGKYHEIPGETIRDYVRENIDLCKESLREFEVTAETIAEKFFDDDYNYFDCTIRCYCLNWAIHEALDELENDGYFDDDENEES